MLKDLLEIGFFEIKTGLNPEVRTFRLYERYKGMQLRIMVCLQNDVFSVEDIFFYSPNSYELQIELFGEDMSVAHMVATIKNLHKSSKPFNDSPETG